VQNKSKQGKYSGECATASTISASAAIVYYAAFPHLCIIAFRNVVICYNARFNFVALRVLFACSITDEKATEKENLEQLYNSIIKLRLFHLVAYVYTLYCLAIPYLH
jgi:hypothetical protein